VEHHEIIQAANAAINHIKSLGAIIQDPADLPSAEEIPACQTATEALVCSTSLPTFDKFDQLVTDFKIEVQKYLEDLKESQVRTLGDLINFNDANAAVAFPPEQCCQEVFLVPINLGV
jgi:amidase